MSRITWIVLGSGVGILGIALSLRAFLAPPEPAQTHHSETKSSRHVAAAAPARRPARAPRLYHETPPVVADEVASAPAPEEEPAAEPPKLSDNLDEYRDYLTVVFDQDMRDRSWEVTAEARVRDGLAKLDMQGARVQSLECRASLCRVVMDADDAGPVDNAKSAILHSMFWSGPRLVTGGAGDEGAHEVVAFFGREGRELPDG